MKQKSVFLTIAVLLGLRIDATAQTIPSYVPTDGLVGWWPFNGNANDESGNGNNGTVNGATLTEDRFGNGNAAYEFDGVDDNVVCVLPGPTGDSVDVAVTFWIKTNQSTYGEILGYGNNQITGEDFRVYINGQPGCSNAIYFDSYESAKGISDNFSNVWDFYTLIYKGTSLNGIDSSYFYKNGVLQNSGCFYTSVSAINISDLIPLTFGSYHGNLSLSSYYQGDMDDIGIWNRALTQEEITDLYNANLCYEYITVTDTLIINLNPTGFNPVTYANTILMYPNPTSEELTINYGDFASLAGYTLKIFNSIGQEIHSANIIQQQEVLQLVTWGGAGTYQVVIYNAQGVPVDTRTIVLQD